MLRIKYYLVYSTMPESHLIGFKQLKYENM